MNLISIKSLCTGNKPNDGSLHVHFGSVGILSFAASIETQVKHFPTFNKPETPNVCGGGGGGYRTISSQVGNNSQCWSVKALWSKESYLEYRSKEIPVSKVLKFCDNFVHCFQNSHFVQKHRNLFPTMVGGRVLGLSLITFWIVFLWWVPTFGRLNLRSVSWVTLSLMI